MPARFRLCLLLLCLLAVVLSGCELPGSVSTNGQATMTSTNKPMNTWLAAGSGIEVRYELWKSEGDHQDTVIITRINPANVQISVEYQPEDPLLMHQWVEKTGARVLLNGGYFDKNNEATALVVSNGQRYGTSYNGIGGMFSVNSAGKLSVRALSKTPYSSSERLQQATQSSPMFVVDGKRTNFEANAANSRRTVIAIDNQGSLLIMVSPTNAFSLDEMADLVLNSDLNIQQALNLDGGASTGLYINSDKEDVTIDSYTALPIVIAIK